MTGAGVSGGVARPATATVLFTDLVGSTELRQQLGDDRADQLRRDHDGLLGEAVAAHGGLEVKGTGDGLMAVFPAAAPGVAAAVAMQRALERYSRRSGVSLGLRIGISAGDVSWEGNDCFGTPVVEAARLCAVATGGQILVSEIVRLLAGSRGGHAFVSVGPLDLKGLTEAVAAHDVLWVPEPTASLALPAVLTVTESVSFVGRVMARQVLEVAWKEAATSDRRRVVLVSGEPGVGKTRLAAELARKAHEDGATVMFGRCDEELGVPYQPFAEALAGFVSSCPADELSAQLGPYAGDLIRLVPDLSTHAGVLPDALRAEPETERFRLFEAVDAFLATTAALAPVVLLLDDLHWAAQPTLLLLRHLVRSNRPARVLIVGTYRDTDLGRGHPLADMLADFRREANVERLDLAGLDESEVAAFLEAAAGHSLDDSVSNLVHRLHAETEGNPFFVGQVLRNLVESGGLVHRDGHWVAAGGVAVGLPEGVREVIGRRLSRLPETTIKMLEAAAVIGREFDDRLLMAAAEVDLEEVLDGLERAEAARLIEVARGAPGSHAFVHALVRSTLYEELPTTRRLRLHRRVGEAIESRGSSRADVLADLAHHFAESAALGEEAKAATYGLQAARAAWDRLAYEESARICDQALATLDEADRATAGVRADLFLQMAVSYGPAGDLERTAAAADQAAEIGRRLGRPELIAEAAVARNGRRTWGDAGLIDGPLVALLEEALGALPATDNALRARCLARLASELYFDPDSEQRRRQLVNEALAMARRVGDDDALGYVMSSAAWVSWRVGGGPERLALCEETRALAERSGDHELLVSSEGWLAGCCLELLQRDAYDAALDRFVVIAAELRQPMYEWWSLLAQATRAILDGRFEVAVRLSEAALSAGQRWPTALQMYGVQLLALRRATGGVEELLPLTLAMTEQFPLIPAWRTGLALVYVELGQLEEAGAQLDILAANDFADMPLDANWLVGVSLCALAAHAVGDGPRAAVLYDLLLPHAQTAVLAGTPADCLGSASAFLAMAAAACGRWDEWERHSADARRHHQALRSPSLQARFALADALSLVERGDRPGALARLDECQEQAEAIGMSRILAQATDLRRLLTGPDPS